jgi:hypothetical protein
VGLVGFATALVGQATPADHWSELLVTSAERVEIDRTAIQLGPAGVRRISLRWNLSRGTTPGVAVYTVEQVELDCRAGRGRVLRSHRELVDETGRHRDMPDPPADSAGSWHTYPDGSLGARVWDAACGVRASGA